MSAGPSERRKRLKAVLETNPFLSDGRLASHFGVSTQTIRLDRMALGIPDQRTRTKEVAERAYGRVKSLGHGEIVGELIDLVLGKQGISTFNASPETVFQRSGIVRSHYIFAQAESLAICVIDAKNVVTGIANLKFKRSARVGEKLIAKAQVLRVKGNKSVVLVETKVNNEQIFRGKFLVFAV